MSFSSTSSKESATGGTGSNRTTNNHTSNESNGAALHSSLSEPGTKSRFDDREDLSLLAAIPTSETSNRTIEKHPIPSNGKERSFASSPGDLVSAILGSTTKNSTARFTMPAESGSASVETEPSTPTITKAERDQELHKYYRADLIQHLTDWSSTQLEKQVGEGENKLLSHRSFSSSVFKTFRRLLRIQCENVHRFHGVESLEIEFSCTGNQTKYHNTEVDRRLSNLLLQFISLGYSRLLRCQQHMKEREDDQFS